MVAFLLFLSTLLIRGNVLTTGFYLNSLDEARAFDRVYDDLLSDPEFAEAIEPFFGSIGIDRSYAVSTLRFVAPPEQLRAWTEDALDRVTGYIRGDVPRYSGVIDLAELIENQRSALVTYVTTLLLQSDQEPTASQVEFEAQLDSFVSQLASGRISPVIPVATISPEGAERVTTAILRPLNPQSAAAIRTQVETYVSLNDIVGALSAAVPALLEDEIELANQLVLEWLGGDTAVDPATMFADVVQDGGNQVVMRLDSFRTQANVMSPPWLPWLSIPLMAVALAGLFWLTGGTTARLMRAGTLITATGAAVLVLAFAAGSSIASLLAGNPFDRALSDRPEGWGLPLSARNLIRDIESAMFSDLADTALIAGLILALTGLAVIVVAQLIIHLPAAARGRYDWIFSKETAPVVSIIALGAALIPLLILNAPDRDPELTCNGSALLCDRPYDEVTYAATHNSMANSADGWVLPSQDISMLTQLEDGVRALLIDSHYWQEPAVAFERLVGENPGRPELFEFLERFLAGFGSPPPGTYLCHLTCWAGAVQLADALTDVRRFLEENTGEVVTLIIQDSISAEDTEEAFIEAGLLPLVFRKEPDEPWPMLRGMVLSNQRLVVMAEVGSPPPDWYLNAWSVMQETPFDARSMEGLSCAEGRGLPGNSLFLINHWINRTPPDRVDAAMVNGRDVVVQRARQCEEERGLKPNFVAVNFYRQGDLFGAVDVLNGLDAE